MKTKEFNLSKRRERLLELCKRRNFNIESIFQEIENQDKEFIKGLKEEFCECEEFPKSDRICVYCNKIDKLT